jgi:purine nucleosidase
LIKTIYFMGGTLHAVGNITMGAEFNVWVDPEAADIVFRSGARLVITPWETARNDAVMSVEDREAIGKLATPTAEFFYKATRALYEYTQQVEGKPGGIHSDIIGMTVPLFPGETLDKADMYMAVELGGELSRGVTFLDWVGLTGKPANVTIVKAIDRAAFRQHIIDMCRRS